MAWWRRRAESRLQMHALKQALDEATPPDLVRDWIRNQSPEVQGWLRDLQFSMGGQSVAVVMAKITEQGWDMPREVATALAESLARGPEYHTHSNGRTYVHVRSPGGSVRLDALLATGTVRFGSRDTSA